MINYNNMISECWDEYPNKSGEVLYGGINSTSKTQQVQTGSDIQQTGVENKLEVGSSQIHLDGSPRPADSYCQHYKQCPNHSDLCQEVGFRDCCSVKEDFVWGKNGVGL